jgi:uncharacterized repeat protein (TIGR03803 family)
MKRPIYFIIQMVLMAALLASSLSAFAQQSELWGVIPVGGASDLGTIYKTDIDGNNPVVQHEFLTPYPGAGGTSLTAAPNGKMYGFTSSLFEFDPATSTYTPLYKFDGVGTAVTSASGQMVVASNGKMYGVGNGGYGYGVVFEYTPGASAPVTKYSFHPNVGGATNGTGPVYPAGIILGTNGKIYINSGGGAFGRGAISEYDITTNVLVKKADLDATTGGTPSGNLVEAPSGKLYGMMRYAGVSNGGTLFECDLTTGTVSKKMDFAAATGTMPEGAMVRGGNGKLYGVTSQGGASLKGVFFEYNPATNTYTVINSFAQNYQGSPYAGPMVASNGLIYGASGSNSLGVIYEYNTTTSTFNYRATFVNNYRSAYDPRCVLAEGTDGKFYGTTYWGGVVTGDNRMGGALFKFDPSNNAITTIFSFNEAPNGSKPDSYLLAASNGKLYGIAPNGGSKGSGFIFEYDRVTHTYTTKVDFSPKIYPQLTASGGLIQATNGKLYGLSKWILMEYDYVSNTYTEKMDLWPVVGTSTFHPFYGSVIQATNGKLYGTTNYGGVNNKGILFEYDLTTSTYTKRADFSTTNGGDPLGSLVQATDGKLYGVTRTDGANNAGTVFSFDTGTNTFTKMIDNPATILAPRGGLMQAADGKMYGFGYGGQGNNGCIYQYDPVANTLVKKIDLYGYSNYPSGELVETTAGKLFGLAGGSGFVKAAILEYDYTNNTLAVKTQFNLPGQAIGSRLLIIKGNQTITFDALAAKSFTDANFTLNATASSGLPVTYTSSNPSVASVTGNTVTIHAAGTTNITAIQEGNMSYFPATAVQHALVINKAPLTATAQNAARTYGTSNPAFTISYSGFKGTENASSLDVLPVAATTATQQSDAGTYAISASGGLDDNYSFTYVPGTLTISKASATATADTKTKTYGDANPAFTVSYQGLMAWDNPSVIDTPPSGSTTALQFSSAGTYPITLSAGTDNNYTFTLVNSTLTTNKASLTVTADAKTKLYGDGNPILTYTYAGLKGSDTASDIDVAPTISTPATTTSNVGTYPITLSGGSDVNYSLVLVDAILTINKAPLTITATNKTKVYGDVNPAFTVTYSGFKGSDNAAVLDSAPVPSSTATTMSNVGNYDITIAIGLDNNYQITTITGSLSITKASLAANATNKTKEYGSANPALTITYTGFKGTDTQTVLDVQPTPATPAVTMSPVGTYTITLSGGSDNNYSFVLSSGTLTVTKATLVAKADNKTRVYGDNNPAFTITYTGFKGPDGSADVDTPPTPATTATPASAAASYNITLSGGLDNNYTFTLTSGTLTVTKAPLTATANAATKTYGQSNPAFTISYGGFKLTDSPSVIDVAPTLSTPANTSSDVGSYTISLTGGSDNNYTLTLFSGTLTITKAPLQVMADAKARVYATDNPDLTFTYSGFVLAQNESVLDLQPSISTTAGLYSPVGNYNITLAGGSDNNYQYSYLNSTLTIYKAEQEIIFAAIGAKTFGDPQFILFAIGGPTGNPVTFTSSNPAVVSVFGNVGTVTGTGTTIITASQAGNLNYNAAPVVMQTVDVNAASQTITFAPLPLVVFGDPAFNAGATSSSGLPIVYNSSDPAVATVDGSLITITGTGTTTITATQSGNANFLSASDVSQVLTVGGSDVMVTASSNVICMGTSATLTADGASTYAWSPVTGLSSATGSSIVASPLVTTTYTVVGTYANGVTATKTITIKVNAKPIAAGGSHSVIKYCGTCGGTVTASGLNTSGQLGDGTTVQRIAPKVVAIDQVDAVAAGASHTLILKNDGTVYSTGLNSSGQLGLGNTTNATTPTIISGLTNVVAIAAGHNHSLFVKGDGTVWACGLNSDGQLGIGTTTNSLVPVQITALAGIVKVSGGASHSVFLGTGGTVWAVGRNANGQLGDGTSTGKLSPIVVPGLSGITEISAGASHTHFLKNNGVVYATGLNTNGQLGNATTTSRTTPGALATISYVTSISGGTSHTLFLRNDGTAWATGINSNGQLGLGNTTQATAPQLVANLVEVTAISAAALHSLFVTSDGVIWAAGRNANGQLGDNSTTTRTLSVSVTNASPCGKIQAVNQPTTVSAETITPLFAFPNPADDQITVELPQGAVTEKTVITLFDGTGRPMKTNEFKAGENSKQIFTGDLTPGIYLLRVGDGNSTMIRKVTIIH